jgi:hypothetical protein
MLVGDAEHDTVVPDGGDCQVLQGHNPPPRPSLTDTNLTDPNLTDPNLTDPNLTDPIGPQPHSARRPPGTARRHPLNAADGRPGRRAAVASD